MIEKDNLFVISILGSVCQKLVCNFFQLFSMYFFLHLVDTAALIYKKSNHNHFIYDIFC